MDGGPRLPAGFRMTPRWPPPPPTTTTTPPFSSSRVAAVYRTAKALCTTTHYRLHLRHRPARFTKRAPTCRRVRAVCARRWPHSRSVYYYICTHKIMPPRFNSSSTIAPRLYITTVLLYRVIVIIFLSSNRRGEDGFTCLTLEVCCPQYYTR